jgi:shikimate kinase
MAQAAPLVVLVGPPAAGKTRLGKRVSKLLGVEFLDTDALVASRYGPIPALFAAEGEASFREKERAAVVEALASTGVVALGGGAVINPDTRADLRSHRVALVSITAEAVEPRLNSSKRPLLTGGLESWVSLVAARTAWYDEVATANFDTSTTPLDTVAENIVEWIKSEAA